MKGIALSFGVVQASRPGLQGYIGSVRVFMQGVADPGHLRVRVLASLKSQFPTNTESESSKSIDADKVMAAERARKQVVVGRGDYRLLGGGGGGFGVPVVS